MRDPATQLAIAMLEVASVRITIVAAELGYRKKCGAKGKPEK